MEFILYYNCNHTSRSCSGRSRKDNDIGCSINFLDLNIYYQQEGCGFNSNPGPFLLKQREKKQTNITRLKFPIICWYWQIMCEITGKEKWNQKFNLIPEPSNQYKTHVLTRFSLFRNISVAACFIFQWWLRQESSHLHPIVSGWIAILILQLWLDITPEVRIQGASCFHVSHLQGLLIKPFGAAWPKSIR